MLIKTLFFISITSIPNYTYEIKVYILKQLIFYKINISCYSEMIKQNAQSKNNNLKLPQIRSKISSSSMKQEVKLRPSSLNKIQDLQKKLFNKLDVYEDITRKKPKKLSKQISNPSVDNSINLKEQNLLPLQQHSEHNLQKLKRVMPHIYGKLMQARKGQTLISKDVPKKTTLRNKTLKAQPTTKALSTAFMTQTNIPSSQAIQQLPMVLNEQQLQEIYAKYRSEQGLQKQTSTKQLLEMKKNLQQCSTQIDFLEDSMQNLIKQIGNIYASEIEYIDKEEDTFK